MVYFYPRPPRGGRQGSNKDKEGFGDFYPRPPRGGRLQDFTEAPHTLAISIHALREEGDRTERKANKRTAHFYPRPPRGGRPAAPYEFRPLPVRFLSTPSARRATAAALLGALADAIFLSTPSARRATINGHRFFKEATISIHALREEGDHCNKQMAAECGISIHALREEGDL